MLVIDSARRRVIRSVVRPMYERLAYPPPRSSHAALEPLVETGSVHTRLIFFFENVRHAFAEKGGNLAASIDLDFGVWRDGRQVHGERVEGHPLDSVYVWESAAHVPPTLRPFEGTMFIDAKLRDGAGRVIPEAIVESTFGHPSAQLMKFFVDVYGDGRFITSTHNTTRVRNPEPPLQRWVSRRVRRLGAAARRLGASDGQRFRIGSIGMIADEEFESSVLYYTWRRGVGPDEVWAELRNARGEILRAPLPAIGPHAFVNLRLGDLFPDVRDFLGNEVGDLLLDRPLPLLELSARVLVRTTHRGSAVFGVDHAYLSFEAWPSRISRATWAALGKGAHSPFVVVDDTRSKTAVIFFNMVEPDTEKSLGVIVYDAAGRLVAEKKQWTTVPPRGVRRVWMRDVLDEAGVRGDFVGHAEVFYSMDTDSYPDWMHHQVQYVQGEHVEGLQVGVGLWNFPRGTTPGIPDPQGGEPWLSCVPVLCDGEYRTTIALTNCSHAYDYDVDGVVTVELRAGREIVERCAITMPPHAMWYQAVDDLFPKTAEHLRPHGGVGLLMIRPVKIRTWGGQFFHTQRSTGQFSTEHTF